MSRVYNSLDLFSGMGGLTEGLHQAGFDTALAFEINPLAAEAYKLNHTKTEVVTKDIRDVTVDELKLKLKGKTIHLLAGCPPCQGFSSIRRLNRDVPVYDERNSLINEYVRFIKVLMPYTFMMENVPGLIKYDLFDKATKDLKEIGYYLDYKIVNVKDYGVPQRRKRLVMVGSRLGPITVAKPLENQQMATVRSSIGSLPLPEHSNDSLHKIFPNHTEKIKQQIYLTPHNGGSRKDLPHRFILECHKGENVGFNDVYGRLRWDDFSTTITGGCLNPSKGRFLHPEQNRCISAREAALLQSFPWDYKLPANSAIGKIALLIGNALPPKFSYIQSQNIKNHLNQFFHK
jgi:DNA (cytosine-5)-methyltransferase 1